MTTSLNETIDAIREAFEGVGRGEITIHEAEVIDKYGTLEARKKARRLDNESRWEDVPDKDIEQCGDAISHFDPVSWRYYIPRYMEWSLRNHETSKSMTVDQTIYTFMLGNSKSINDYCRVRFHTLSKKQSLAVNRFLLFMSTREPLVDASSAKIALEKFWNKFSK